MNITCPHCKAKLNLPDDKIPKHKDSSFKCPKCKESVHVKASMPKAASGSVKSMDQSKQLSQSKQPKQSNQPKQLRRSGQALVCMPPSPARDRMMTAVQNAGFEIEAPETTVQAFDRLEYRIFPLVIVDDGFDKESKMARYMNEMDMSLRRRICLIRVSPEVPTGDPMTALHSSVNCVINRKDLEQDSEDAALVSDILALALEDHGNFYTIFNDSMKATGKA